MALTKIKSGGLSDDLTIEFDSLSGTGAVAVTNILDEDNLVSNSATALATQQSIKAYVDTTVGATFFYNGAAKLATTSTGIDVTGTATMDGLDVNGTITAYGLNFDVSDGVEINALESIVFDIDSDNNQSSRVFQVKANNSTPLFTIQEEGRVGIGTSSPTRPLQIELAEDTAGTFQTNFDIKRGWTSGVSTDRYTGMSFSDYNSISAGIYANRNSSHANFESDLCFYTNSGSSNVDPSVSLTKKMSIMANGNVGIGESSPAAALQITTATNTPLLLKSTHSGGGYAEFAVGASGAVIGYMGSAAQLVTGGSSSDLNIRAQGNFSIGTGGNTERMRIDANGTITQTTSSASPVSANFITGNSNCDITMNSANTSSLTRLRNGTNDFQVHTNGTERMRIDASGNLLVGTTSTISLGQVSVLFDGTNKNGLILKTTRSITGSSYLGFINSAGASIGSISQNATSTVAYNTSSDQRLKENIADAEDAGSKVDAIQVRKFDWKADGSHQDYGMIAQELQTVAPEAVSVPEDSEEMMGVDYSKLVPMMLKEIQSLRQRVAALEE